MKPEDKYAAKLTAETQRESIEIPYTDGAQTHRVVAASWALPPDYFDAFGDPMGFDAAMPSERAGGETIPIEVVLRGLNGGSMAVSIGKADIHFCYTAVFETEKQRNGDGHYELAHPDERGSTIGSVLYERACMKN